MWSLHSQGVASTIVCVPCFVYGQARIRFQEGVDGKEDAPCLIGDQRRRKDVCAEG